MTVAGLVRAGPDGRDAVRDGLNQLQQHGYFLRQQFRHDDGTLGESVYSITDRPAPAGTGYAAPARPVPTAARAGGAPSYFEAGLRRGVMAADRFTQIANALFRDPRLSFKAKGIFGFISTHRDGWRMSVTHLARCSRDGEAAITSGLRELEKHGFLLRERQRNPDGTLGAAAYFITDLPSLQHSRSQPVSDYPPVDNPTPVDRPTKNTNRKNTTKQKTRALPPCDHTDATRKTRASERPDAAAELPADEMHPGIQLLLEIAATHPALLLTGKALIDQGRVATVMLEAGWSREQLWHLITYRPLPQPVRTTVGAIIAARLRAAQAYPPPAMLESRHHHGDISKAEPRQWQPAEQPAASATRTVTEALTHRPLAECAGCGVPSNAPGEDLCPACLGWPLCRTCPGPTPRRARPGSAGRCTTCATASRRLLEEGTL